MERIHSDSTLTVDNKNVPSIDHLSWHKLIIITIICSITAKFQYSYFVAIRKAFGYKVVLIVANKTTYNPRFGPLTVHKSTCKI